jgi:hypothetical protein
VSRYFNKYIAGPLARGEGTPLPLQRNCHLACT